MAAPSNTNTGFYLALSVVGALVTAGGLAVVAWQTVEWLRSGYWPGVPALEAWNWTGLPIPQLYWLGVEPMIEWILRQPLSLVMLVCGWMLLWISGGRART
jgi:hypothetical protein